MLETVAVLPAEMDAHGRADRFVHRGVAALGPGWCVVLGPDQSPEITRFGGETVESPLRGPAGVLDRQPTVRAEQVLDRRVRATLKR